MKFRKHGQEYELSEEAYQLICDCLELAAVDDRRIIEGHELELASTLINAAILNIRHNRITSSDIYRGWDKEISEKMVPLIGLCPVHKCLVRSIIKNDAALSDAIRKDKEMMRILSSSGFSYMRPQLIFRE